VISGDILREARLRAGLSQAELARRAGTHPSAVGRGERGEALPSLEKLRELVRACGLELTFRIANADLEDHDLTLIRQALLLTPAERFEHAQKATRAVRRLWPSAVPAADG
jgi:transcriptional regulator with XRE-family HTH domain